MALIGDLLALAATKTMGFEERTEAVELTAVVQWAVEQHAAAAKVKRVGLRVRLPREKVDVRATRDGLAGVLENLIGNAVKYTPADGQVEVRVGLRATSAEVVIADTGMGIPRDEMPRLWEEFFRASNARHSGIVGTGLGLSIVKRLVDSFGGMISVQSEEGRGTTFTVVLPLEAAAPEPAPAA
jgi:signal transduction histidine kinase